MSRAWGGVASHAPEWWRWAGPAGVTLLAAGLRLTNLGHPHTLVFDETYYVKDAYSLSRLGYEGVWKGDAVNAAFASGDVSGLGSGAEFVVHPPLGKWLISLGISWFGPADSFGWRVTTALAGVLAVWLVAMIAWRIFRSSALATIAGALMAIEGNAIVMSRVAILDNWLMLFALMGFGAVLVDRERADARLSGWLQRRISAGRPTAWGPALVNRPWLMLAGVCFGAASAVKWSGVWFLAAFVLYVVLADLAARRRARLAFWLEGGLLKQAPLSVLSAGVPALATYLASWWGWIATSGGYARQWAVTNHATGLLPDWLVSLWQYHVEAYGYHVGLRTPHPYSANPLTWLFMVRPTSMYYESFSTGCAGTSCSEAITGLANPLIWWAATASVLLLGYWWLRGRHRQYGVILLGVAAGYLPWLGYLERTVFEFYTIAFEPYLILALTAVLGLIANSGSVDPRPGRRGWITVAVFLAAAAALSVFFYPIWTGIRVPYEFWLVHMWLPSWI